MEPTTKKRGRPKGQPKTGGRQLSPDTNKQAKTLRLALDVVAILDDQENQTAYVEAAVRSYALASGPPEPRPQGQDQ